MKQYVPDLTRPGNEWLVYAKLAVVVALALLDIVSELDFTTPEGLVAGVLLIVSTITARAKSYGAETVAEMDDREVVEVD